MSARYRGLIFAILGRAKIEEYKTVTFQYKDKLFNENLAARVISKAERLKPVYFLPHSLYKGQLLDDVAYISPALGFYSGKAYFIRYDSLVFYYFIQMLNSFFEEETGALKGNNSLIILDVSVGLNIYLPIIMEAFWLLETFLDFYYLFSSSKPQLKVMYSDPIIGSQNYSYNIYLEDFVNFKKSGYQEVIIPFTDIGRVNFFEKVFLEEAYYITTSIIKNIPLVPFSFKYSDIGEVKKNIQGALERIRAEFMDDNGRFPRFQDEGANIKYRIDISLSRSDVKSLLQAFLTLSLYFGMAEGLTGLSVPKKAESWASLGLLKKVVDILYSKLYLNEARLYFERDFVRIERIYKKAEMQDFRRGSLLCKYAGNKMDKCRKISLSEKSRRNFYAHSGLLTQLIEATRYGIRYCPSELSLVKQLLIESPAGGGA